MRLIFWLIILNLFLIPLFLYVKFHYQPRVLIIPHHNVVQTIRQSVINEVAHRRLSTHTVILLSPDHFNPSQFSLTTSDSDWTLSNGQILYDQYVGKQLISLLSSNKSAVKSDHGIYNLLPDIHAAFPHAKIIPILLGQNLQPKHLNPLLNQLILSCQTDCLLIASVDFSHYLPLQLANVHDAFSLKALSNLDENLVMQAEVDSPQSLYLALQFAKAYQSNRFVLEAHTNSGALVNNYDAETTSHILGWFQPGLPNPKNSTTFVYANNLDRKLNQATLGDRFFYGVDNINTYHPSIPENLVLAGIDWGNKRQLIYLPLSSGPSKNSVFARGQEKQNILNKMVGNSSGLINYPQ